MTEWRKQQLTNFYTDQNLVEFECKVNGRIADILVPKKNKILMLQATSTTLNNLMNKVKHFSKTHKLLYLFNLTEKQLSVFQDSNCDKYYFKVNVNCLGKNIPMLYEYIKVNNFNNKVTLFLDSGSCIFEFKEYCEDGCVLLKRHDYEFFKDYIVLNKEYSNYNVYRNDKVKVKVKRVIARYIATNKNKE